MNRSGSRPPGLTRRQRDIIRFFEDFIWRNGYAPSLREIGAAVGLKSASSVSYQVQKLLWDEAPMMWVVQLAPAMIYNAKLMNPPLTGWGQ